LPENYSPGITLLAYDHRWRQREELLNQLSAAGQ